MEVILLYKSPMNILKIKIKKKNETEFVREEVKAYNW